MANPKTDVVGKWSDWGLPSAQRSTSGHSSLSATTGFASMACGIESGQGYSGLTSRESTDLPPDAVGEGGRATQQEKQVGAAKGRLPVKDDHALQDAKCKASCHHEDGFKDFEALSPSDQEDD